MKKIFMIVLCICTALSFVSCSDNDQTSNAESGSATPEEVVDAYFQIYTDYSLGNASFSKAAEIDYFNYYHKPEYEEWNKTRFGEVSDTDSGQSAETITPVYTISDSRTLSKEEMNTHLEDNKVSEYCDVSPVQEIWYCTADYEPPNSVSNNTAKRVTWEFYCIKANNRWYLSSCSELDGQQYYEIYLLRHFTFRLTFQNQ